MRGRDSEGKDRPPTSRYDSLVVEVVDARQGGSRITTNESS